MAEDSKVDLVAQLPDEVLMEIVGHLPSLRDKLRLESVNTRFQRCLVDLLRIRPIPFTYNAIWGKRLNGYDLTMPFAEALKFLGNKVKFSSIDIRVLSSNVLDSVLAALVSSDIDCLDKVTTFKVNCGCKETLLADLFAKCSKLSEVRLDFEVSGTDNYSPTEWGIPTFPLHLGVVLKDKALTRLTANLSSYPQELVIQMFQSIKPNTLKKIVLCFGQTALNMDVLVTELCGGGWSALEEMDIDWFCRNLPIDTLFSSLNRLPKLKKCNFNLEDTRGMFDEYPTPMSLAAALTSLFANRAQITVHYDILSPYSTHPTGCEFVALIRQVQSVHPQLEVGFGPNGRRLTLTLDEVTFKQLLVDQPPPCNNAHCPDCRIFYPTIVSRIESEANRLVKGGLLEQVHLSNARLDRCRMDSVADRLNGRGRWKALEARMNEAGSLATITFEPSRRHNQFKITVDCGHCLNNGCFGCLYVG